MGGTDLTTATGPESTWNDGIVNDGNGYAVSAGGGGQSTKWQMPSWQTALGNIAGSNRLTCGAPSGSLCREVPDVSASADPFDGYPIYVAGSWNIFGGTSAAAPTWASLLTLVDASCGGHRLGLINPALYHLRAGGTTDFRASRPVTTTAPARTAANMPRSPGTTWRRAWARRLALR